MSQEDRKPQVDRNGNITNLGVRMCLPPGVTTNSPFGQLFVEMGELKWLTYDGTNYLENFGKGAKVQDLYANLKFWGEPPTSKGIFLKFRNGLKAKKETGVFQYKYQVNCPEQSFEKYIDDMGALIIDFYSVQDGMNIGTSKIIVKLFVKRQKIPTDTDPLIELRGTFPITLTGNQNVKIGEFNLAITSQFGGPSAGRGSLNEPKINNQINQNEDSFEMNEQAAQNSVRHQNQRIHDQMHFDDRVPSSLQNRNQNPFEFDENSLQVNERPTRDKKPAAKQGGQTQNSKNLNFESRKQIVIDENDDTINSNADLAAILSRGERLQRQMEDALNPSTQVWEQIHGMHNVAKSYIPPFMREEHEKMQEFSPDKMEEKLYEMQVESEALKLPGDPATTIQAMEEKPTPEMLETAEANKRQIKDMKFIRVKVKNLSVHSTDLIPKLIDKSFKLYITIPLPDVYRKSISTQTNVMSTYEVIDHNEYAFNSLSLFNFRVDEDTLAQYVQSKMEFGIEGFDTKGYLNMNRLMMSHDFKLEATVPLEQRITQTQMVRAEGKKKLQEHTESQLIQAGSLSIEINLQSGDSEDEMKRNFEIKMQTLEEQRAKEEAERQEQTRKKMQFVMEQQPVFGQLYLNIQKLGHNDNIGKRTPEQQAQALLKPQEVEGDDEVMVQADGFGSSLNNRVSGTEEEGKQGAVTDSLERAPEDKINVSKRNLFFQFKAFPNLELLKTGTVWQKDGDCEFNYRSQFPVLMCPETLEKMEKFILVLELWDQVSPSVKEFMGLVKIPLAPICYSMLTTDQEIYSLNFMADQFCMYPMTICDGFLPVYSPKLGQNIAHVKINLSMGSPVQVTRLIQREMEEERRKQRDIEERKIREAEYQKEKEMKEARRAKKEKKRQLEEEKRQREEAKKAEEENQMAMFGGLMGGNFQTKNQKGMSPGKLMQGNIGALLRQSMNSQMTLQDYDQRNQSMLNCMRKMFEETRAQFIEELNGEEVFPDDMKNFDGSVNKDQFVYQFLNNDKFSLTRIDLAQITALMLDINRDDQGKFDIDELHFSYRSYVKYYELIEQRIIDLLEKFKLSITKKFEIDDLIDEFIGELESKAHDSKMSIIQLREIIEDRHGIVIRDALYDQFMLFFDLDRDQQVYITSLCQYIKNTSSQKINFFKVSTAVITNQIQQYIKNSVETAPECLIKLEEEFKQEVYKTQQIALQIKRGEPNPNIDDLNMKLIPADILIKEKVNAKLFQYKLKKLGIALSLWEVFTLFESLNTQFAKMHFEPQRYHHIMFGTFYQFITNEEYTRTKVGKPQPGQRSKSRSKSRNRGGNDTRDGSRVYDIEGHGYNHDRDSDDDDESESQEGGKGGYYHKNEMDDTEDPRKPYKQVKHVFEIKVKELRNVPVLNKFICQTNNNTEMNINHNSILNKDPKLQKIAKQQANKYIQNVAVKYSFPLDEDEILESDYLQLNRDALDQQGTYNYHVSMDTVHTYVLDKEDSIKKVLELCQSRGGSQNPVSLQDEIENGPNSQARREELFIMSVALFQDNREYIIGNAHLPIEDLVDTIQQYETRKGTFDRRTQKSFLSRTLFMYGTTYSQRENCIIGKLQLEINYSQEKLIMSKKEAKIYQAQKEKGEGQFNNNPYSCFMHRETYINRKIPLNAKLSVLIDRVQHLKESIENIEHFAKIQHSALGLDMEHEGDELYGQLQDQLCTTTIVHNRRDHQHLDRRRVLKHILKNGLNLIVHCSVFEEDQDLVKKFQKMSEQDNEALVGNYGKYQTRMLYNSLNPVFGEVFEMNLQMDTKIFEYLKNKRAVFEVRHYIIETSKQKQAKMRESMAMGDVNERMFADDQASEHTIGDGEVQESCDFIVLGTVRVPLLQLITKNNGVDGDFSIFDEFKQRMGSLKLRLTLNHHNSQRPLYSTTSKIPDQIQPALTQNTAKSTIIDKAVSLNSQMKLGTLSQVQFKKQKAILGFNFIELIMKNRFNLVQKVEGQTQRFFIKFRMFNQIYQTKFFGAEQAWNQSSINNLLQKINLQRFDISKTSFVELDFADQLEIEQAFGKPLEVQLWHKVESVRTYEKPIHEEMIGQFFIELNELTKVTNRRLKEPQVKNQPGRFQVWEGYFTLHEQKKDVLSSDRLGMRLYLFNKDDSNETISAEDLNQLFNQHRPKIEDFIMQKLDREGKGYVDNDDLIQAVKDHIPNEYLSQKLIWFITQSLEFKSVDKVYYSPLFGLPPPFFKYSKKFDQIEIITKFNQEFEALDSRDNGFIPANILKNSLEGEMNIKAKIVDDFINSLRDIDIENQNEGSQIKLVKEVQSLDVNLVTNSLKTSHVDYVVLLRKLAQYMDQNSGSMNLTTPVPNRVLDQIQEHESAQEVTMYFEVDNGMRLKNPLNSREPPNVYVYMKPTFAYKEQGMFVQTNMIKASSYPTWNYKSQNFTVPINLVNRDFISNCALEFEVFHKDIGASNNLDVKESCHLIGVAFVPLKGFIEGSGKTRITGLFDVIAKNQLYRQSVQSMSSIKTYEQSLGKIKVCVTSSLNIKRIMDGEAEEKFVPYGSVKQSQSSVDAFRNVSFGYEQNFNPISSFKSFQQQSPQKQTLQTVEQEVDAESVASSQIQMIDFNIAQYNENLQQVTENQLMNLHQMNMSDLEELNQKLKESMTVLNVTVPEKKPTFGNTTFKTDMQRSALHDQMKEFRGETLAKPKHVVNPFQSTDLGAGGRVIEQKAEDLEDLARFEEPMPHAIAEETSQQTNYNRFNQAVAYDSTPMNVSSQSNANASQGEKKDSPAFGGSEENVHSLTDPLNVFARDLQEERKEVEETIYDLAEMERLERIHRQQ